MKSPKRKLHLPGPPLNVYTQSSFSVHRNSSGIKVYRLDCRTCQLARRNLISARRLAFALSIQCAEMRSFTLSGQRYSQHRLIEIDDIGIFAWMQHFEYSHAACCILIVIDRAKRNATQLVSMYRRKRAYQSIFVWCVWTWTIYASHCESNNVMRTEYWIFMYDSE